MKETMMAAEASVRETVRLLEDLAQEARETQNQHADAIEVLTQMAEALLVATQNLAQDVSAETVVAK